MARKRKPQHPAELKLERIRTIIDAVQGMNTICNAAKCAVRRHNLVEAMPTTESEATP